MRRLFALSLLFLAALGVFQTVRGRAAAGEPVWGRKPVLEYFALNPSLGEELKSGADLSLPEFQLVQEIARQEGLQLQQLLQASLAFSQNETLSLSEKRARIAEMGYNQQMSQIIAGSQQALKAALDADTYARLVGWIEARWQIERSLHGVPQARVGPDGGRTYSIFAAQFDASGSYTVALPDQCLKLANGGFSLCDGSGYGSGQNYSVKLDYQNTVTVKAGESGPWNVDDNFWASLSDPQPRRLFTDLAQGMPETQAAYFNDYNGGLDYFGRQVTQPFGIDLSFDVAADLGLPPSTNDWIDVTFQWTAGWDGLQNQVVTLLEPTSLQPAYTGDMCVTAWHQIFPLLDEFGHDAYLTLNVDDSFQSTNSAEWAANLPVSGEYLVRAFIPDHDPIDWLCPTLSIPLDSADARYTISHAGGQTTVSRNQGPMSNQYLDLGSYDFDAGSQAKVSLTDLNAEENLSHTIAFSALQFRQVLPPPTPTASATPTATPTSTPTPTPTPLPSPAVWAGVAVSDPAAVAVLPLGARNLITQGLGQAIVDLFYDPAVVSAVGCQADPNGQFDAGSCQLDFDNDGVAPDIVRFTLSANAGVLGNPALGTATFQVIGGPGAFSPLEVSLVQISDPGGAPIPAGVQNGVICISPCRNVFYMPSIFDSSAKP